MFSERYKKEKPTLFPRCKCRRPKMELLSAKFFFRIVLYVLMWYHYFLIEPAGGGTKKKQKSSAFQTISATHRVYITQTHATPDSPHPNTPITYYFCFTITLAVVTQPELNLLCQSWSLTLHFANWKSWNPRIFVMHMCHY